MLVLSSAPSSNRGVDAQSTAGDGRGQDDGEGEGRNVRGADHGGEGHGAGDADVDVTNSHRLVESDAEFLSGRGDDGSSSDREGAETRTASGKERGNEDSGDASDISREGETEDETEIIDLDDIHDDTDDERGQKETTLDDVSDKAEDEMESEATIETSSLNQTTIETSSLKQEPFPRSVKAREKQFYVSLPVCLRKNPKCHLSEYLLPTPFQQHKRVQNPPTLKLIDYCKSPVVPHCRRGRRQKVRRYHSNIHCYYYCIMGVVKKSSDSGEERRSMLHEIQRVCGIVRKCYSLCFYASHLRRVCVKQHYSSRHTNSVLEERDASSGDDMDQNDDTETSDNETPNSGETGSDKSETDKEDKKHDNEGDLNDTASGNNQSDDSVEGVEDDLSDKEVLKTPSDDVGESDLDGSSDDSKLKENADLKGESHGEKKLTSLDFMDDIKVQKSAKTVKTSSESTHAKRSHSFESNESMKARLSEEELRKIEEIYRQKTSEQAAKLQSLELLIVKLENQILSQKLNDQNSTNHIVHLENQILRIENELLRLNQSHAALHEENQILRSKQNKYLAIDHKAQEEKKNQPALPNNSSKYFELVTVQQQKLGMLSELLRNQSLALQTLQQRSDHLEEQNQILHQIIMNQTALVSHVMQKLIEVSEQNMKNQQDVNLLKSAMDTQSASRDIVHKIENMLEKASNKGTFSSVSQGLNSKATDSQSSSILRFTSTIPEFSREPNQWTCAGNSSPQFCLNFVILISPCPPFSALTWSYCPYMLREVELTSEQGPRKNARDSLSGRWLYPLPRTFNGGKREMNTRHKSDGPKQSQAKKDPAGPAPLPTMSGDKEKESSSGHGWHSQGVLDAVEIPSTGPVSSSETAAFKFKDKAADDSDNKVSEPVDSAAALEVLPTSVAADDGNKAEEDESGQQPEMNATLEQTDLNPVHKDRRPATSPNDSTRHGEHDKTLPADVDARDDINPAKEETSHRMKLGSSEQEETVKLWNSDMKPHKVADETKPTIGGVGAEQRGSNKQREGDEEWEKREIEKRKEEEEEKMKEEEAKRKKEEKSTKLKRLVKEAEAKRLKRVEAEKKKREEEAMIKRKQEEEAVTKRKQEEEAMIKRKQEEEAMVKRKQEEEAMIKRKQEEEAMVKRKQEEEAMIKRKQEEEAMIKRKQEEEAMVKRKQEEEAMIKRKQEEEAMVKRKREEEEAMMKRKQEEEAMMKRKQEEEAMMKRKQEEEAMVKRKQEEEAMMKRKQEEEAIIKRKHEEEAMIKKKQEAEAAKKKQEAELMAMKMKEAESRPLPYRSADKRKPEDCYEVYKRNGPGQPRNGAYKIFVKGLKLYVSVFCDMKAGGWTVIMKREDGSLDFYKGWSDYVNGFGTPFSEHYAGNEVIHYLTNQNRYSLQVDLKDWEGNTRTATYKHFWIDDENENFRLHVLGYTGTAGDGLGKHDGMAFSTHDRDNDLLPANQLGGSCSRRFHGAGWYYKCYASNLLGMHYVDGVVPEKKFDGVAWKPWTGPNYSLKEVVLKIKPRETG